MSIMMNTHSRTPEQGILNTTQMQRSLLSAKFLERSLLLLKRHSKPEAGCATASVRRPGASIWLVGQA